MAKKKQPSASKVRDYETTHTIRGKKRKVRVQVLSNGKRKVSLLDKKEPPTIPMSAARERYKQHRKELDKDIRTRSSKTHSRPTPGWMKNPSRSDVEGIDTPSALTVQKKRDAKKEKKKAYKKKARKTYAQQKKKTGQTPKNRRLKLKRQSASGGRKSWYKALDEIDTSKSYGYAFKGDFLPSEREIDVPVGTIIIEGRQFGSVKNPWQEYIAKRVTAEGKNETIARGNKQNFLSFRDTVNKELKKSK